MARFSVRQFSFANGEVSPLLAHRADMEFYFSALSLGVNFILDQFGNLHRRPGTRFVAKSSVCPCFYNFEAAPDCPLIICATPGEFRFFLDGAPVGDPLVTPYGEDDYCDLQYVEDCGAAFFVHPNFPAQKLTKADDGTFLIEPLETSPLGAVNADADCRLCLGAAGADGTDAATIQTEEALSVGDTITTDAGATLTITAALGAGGYEVSIDSPLTAGDYAITQKDGDDLSGDPDGVPGSGDEFNRTFVVALTAATAKMTALGCAPFTADMVGQQICILDVAGVGTNDPNTWVTVTVGAFVSATEIDVEYNGGELRCTDLYQLPAFYDGNYPSSVWIHQDRLYFGNDNCLAGSKAGDFFDWKGFDPDGTVNPDNAIYEKIASGTCADIKWLQTVGRQLLVGTTSNITSFFGAGVGGAFQADATAQQLIENIGVSCIRPVQTSGGGLLFTDAARKRLYATGAGAQYDQIAVADQTIFADHIGEKCFKKVAYQEHKFPIVWAVSDDGCLSSMTFWPGQSVRGWMRHELGGELQSGPCCVKPEVCDVIVQKSADRLRDVVMFAVKRTINGETVYFHEVLGEVFLHKSKIEEAHYVDAALPLGQGAGVSSALVPSGAAPVITAADVSPGRVAVCDRDRWFYGTADGSEIEMDAPNTFKAIPGRTLIQTDDGWRLLPKAKYQQKAEYVDPQCCLYDPPCEILKLVPCVDAIGGLECLEGQEVLAYMDGCDLGCHVVVDGGIDVGGCVGWVGLPYESYAAPLPYRQQLGSTDGAGDPSKVITLAFNVYRTPEVLIGSFGQNEFMQCGDNFKPADFPEAFSTHHRAFHSGWVSGVPFVPVGDNNELGVVLKVWGPWPATIRNMEATIYASGGR